MSEVFRVEDSSQPEEYVQCEVTGNWVPEEDTVIFSGRRVCAEGKQILLERLRSGETMPGELERPSVLRRFGGMLVDGLCLVVVSLVIGLLLGGAVGLLFLTPETARSPATAVLMRALGGVVGVILALFYWTLFHGLSGQSPGKKLAKTKVVNIDGSDVEVATAFLRALYYAGPPLLAQLPVFGMFFDVDPRTVAGLTRIATGIVYVYWLLDLLVALFDRHLQRSLHDRLAGTRVVVVD